jgi:hypothetical protein
VRKSVITGVLLGNTTNLPEKISEETIWKVANILYKHKKGQKKREKMPQEKGKRPK